jgi:hypothetical protein
MLLEHGLNELHAADHVSNERREAAQAALDNILTALDAVKGAIQQAEQRATPAAIVVPFRRS